MSADLLHCYGIWLVDVELAASEDEAADRPRPRSRRVGRSLRLWPAPLAHRRAGFERTV
jgi:hypothetical protein